MCGIAGILHSHYAVRADSAVLHAMNRALAHRGPDDEGHWMDGPVGLAMRRLKIIDLAGGHQPMSNEDGSVWVVFNGEIYNYRELRRELEVRGHIFRSQSDTEVLVHLYEDRGEDLVHALQGMFAFAIWDRRNRKLFLARDPVGIKPLFYYFKDGLFLFGSEMKALLAHPAVSRGIDAEALSDYLSFLTVPAPKTIFRDLRKCQPGHCIVLEDGVMQLRRYYEWPSAAKEEDGKSGTDYRAELVTLAGNAVRSHLMSDVPVGAFLSGGVDSSIVTALMAQTLGPSFHTFSVGFDERSHDELSYAGLVARYLDTKHHELELGPQALEDLPAVLDCFDEPFGDSSAIATYHLSRFARQEVTVALAGDGGDELFAGYEWMRRQRWIELLHRFGGPFAGAACRMLERMIADVECADGRPAALARFFEDARRTPMESFFRRSTCFTDRMKQRLLRPEISVQLPGHSSFALFSLVAASAGENIYDQMLRWDTQVYLPDDDLCKVDRTSMAHSLEVRVPVLDLPLVRWSAGLPLRFKLKGLQTKHIWKEAFGHLLPPRIMKQRKQGFAIPLKRWLAPHLKGIRRMLLAENSFCRTVFRSEEIGRIVDMQATGKYRLAGQVYLMLVLELWAKRMGAETAAVPTWKEMVGA